MRKYCLCVVVMSFLLALNTSCSKEEPTEPEETTTWTIIGYMDGNNNLDTLFNGTSYIVKDVQELEAVGSGGNLNIVVAVGRLKTGGVVKYYHIEHFENELPDSISSPVLQDLGTKDMSDKQTFLDFLNYVKQNYPADKYLLIVDNHGAGWRGCCSDDVNGAGDVMDLVSFREALEQSGIRPEIIVFHACLMAMVEVAYELKDLTKYVVASEFTLPVLSLLNPQSWLADLKNNPDMSSEDLAKEIAQAVYEEAQSQNKPTHMAAIKMSEMSGLGAKIGELANILVTETEQYVTEIYDAWANTHVTNYDDPNNVDLREFLKNLKQESGLSQIPVVVEAIDSALNALNEAIVITYTNTTVPRGGLTIYLPIDDAVFAQDSASYVKLEFTNTNWYRFVSKFTLSYGGGGGGGETDTTGTTAVAVSGTISDPYNVGTYELDICVSHDTIFDSLDFYDYTNVGNSFSVTFYVPGEYTTGDYVSFLAFATQGVDADGDGNADDLIFGFYPDQGWAPFQTSYNITIAIQYYIEDYFASNPGKKPVITKELLKKMKPLKKF